MEPRPRQPGAPAARPRSPRRPLPGSAAPPAHARDPSSAHSTRSSRPMTPGGSACGEAGGAEEEAPPPGRPQLPRLRPRWTLLIGGLAYPGSQEPPSQPDPSPCTFPPGCGESRPTKGRRGSGAPSPSLSISRSGEGLPGSRRPGGGGSPVGSCPGPASARTSSGASFSSGNKLVWNGAGSHRGHKGPHCSRPRGSGALPRPAGVVGGAAVLEAEGSWSREPGALGRGAGPSRSEASRARRGAGTREIRVRGQMGKSGKGRGGRRGGRVGRGEKGGGKGGKGGEGGRREEGRGTLSLSFGGTIPPSARGVVSRKVHGTISLRREAVRLADANVAPQRQGNHRLMRQEAALVSWGSAHLEPRADPSAAVHEKGGTTSRLGLAREWRVDLPLENQ